MSDWSQYWAHIPSAHRTLILVCGLLFFWLLEGPLPLVRRPYHKLSHAGVNLFFTLTTIVVNFAFAFLIVRTCFWTADHRFGLLYLVPLPPWLFWLLGLMLLDLISAWLVHWIEHQVRWMWQFHTIHHIDRHVDTTTANRHHPVESVLRALFTLLAVAVSGAPVWVLMMYQSLSVVFAQFNHANIRLAPGLDRAISWVLVSPGMHKVHHHFQRPFTDSNYGNIFSFWDRLFGTFRSLPPEDLRYGLDTHIAEKDDIGNLLRVPFQKYRPRPR
ncbi:sterol desaturase family protein [Dinghuibacter silviterrae]|uniref:Sterol desaturase/sphingolipid hydroxylase (Fatty acid hydroxylase superfamily) n=1 Tax=Dinghuibacter silviterrae TaxID=1539049 RepID=A0A4R8DPL6_9BACT|nr:sterol desaturase family protein [Dinghuibacter silviterrae]TDW99685.1 sterol desaturase/sphingolipid hydroxylase (fatty acid hydroxylase superfamily) [Dinghuibacter silviterrae]